ncbi:uncharacterized protein V1518DRAFT_222248 [Limtongia smithiae]|uniref:uncharacterized protein n=1 Tax=Limtongia smithiae TaxID=1125753 RepID=UPI0034CFF14A
MKFQLSAAAAVAALVSTASAIPIATQMLSLTGSIGTQYTSDITRNIFTKKIHSHNDYWRDIPLYTALSKGVTSVEADVWHYDGDDTLYVGHHTAALNAERTFSSLYIDPLVEILTANNPNNTFTASQTTPNGVFDTDSTATLYLFVDVKTNGTLTWPYVISALEPLRAKGWLSTYNGTAITSGPITVIGTGNTPYDFVFAQTERDYFYDGPILTLSNQTAYPPTLNPIASGDFMTAIGGTVEPTGLNSTQLATIIELIQTAHNYGIKTRFWDVPWWPVVTRDILWRQLINAGSDFLNADDLDLASTFY